MHNPQEKSADVPAISYSAESSGNHNGLIWISFVYLLAVSFWISLALENNLQYIWPHKYFKNIAKMSLHNYRSMALGTLFEQVLCLLQVMTPQILKEKG